MAEWFDVLVEYGLLVREGDAFINPRAFPVEEVAALLAGEGGSVAISDADARMLAFMQERNEQLADILRGDKDPLAVLFPEGALDNAELIYETNAESRFYNAIAGSLMQAIASRWPASQPLRILEAGAGVGGITVALLPALAGRPAHYTFTDISLFFTNQARRKFAAYPFVEYGLLDIDKDPAAQGYDAHAYDVVVAANVLHNARSIRDALGRVVSLLAPNGLLILLEVTHTSRSLLTWHRLLERTDYDDERSQTGRPMLSQPEWKQALQAAGFTDIVAFPGDGSPAAVLGQRILLAQAPAGVPASPAVLKADGLKAFLRQKLPEYMVPAHFVMLDTLPLSSNGKVDRKALPPFDVGHAESTRTFAAPGTPNEILLAAIWAELLGQPRVSVADNFFELGGDSILGIQVSAMAGRAGLSISPRQVFEHQTIAELAAAARPLSAAGAPDAAQKEMAQRELETWSQIAARPVPPLPVDPAARSADAGPPPRRPVAEATVSLLPEALSAYQLQTEELLATALAQTLAEWTENTRVLIDIYAPAIELSPAELLEPAATRHFPAWLELNETSNLDRMLKTAKEQLRSVPARGANFASLASHLDQEGRDRLAALTRPQVALACSVPLDDTNRYFIEVTAQARGDGLVLGWRYDPAVYARATMDELAGTFVARLNSLIAYCLSPEAGGYTPSDFPDLQISQQDLDDLLEGLE
jgi:SAM-dependent methyltransferase